MRVNCVCPEFTDTAMVRDMLAATAAQEEEMVQTIGLLQ